MTGQKTVSYADWYVLATARIASDAFKAFGETGCAPHYLYFKPNGLMFAIVQEDMPKPEGFELVTGERIPSDRTLEGLTYWIRMMTARTPVLPGD